jgi:hypothetical protein
VRVNAWLLLGCRETVSATPHVLLDFLGIGGHAVAVSAHANARLWHGLGDKRWLPLEMAHQVASHITYYSNKKSFVCKQNFLHLPAVGVSANFGAVFYIST